MKAFHRYGWVLLLVLARLTLSSTANSNGDFVRQVWSQADYFLAGLVLLAAGSLIAASSDHIYGVVLVCRAVQGMGAIAAAVLALAADLTRDGQRTKVMAAIGMCIGFSFGAVASC
ncbi:MFS transporter [Paucibacter sp. O1-1]|nr:MFS transporter [Paucibacter sp. O1-1]MDA3830811.1 MFS transporter [Paucibacter sp. O1-1]